MKQVNNIYLPRQAENDVEQKFIDSLTKHIQYVQEAGEMIGVHPNLLAIHDNSKWFNAEFYGYAKHFHGGGDPNGFAYAWIHHIHNNPHHWQHWIFPDNFTPKDSEVENGIMQMPNVYAKEMIADWMGSSMAYTGSWDMTEWLSNNIPKIRVHSRTADFLRAELDNLGYADIVFTHKFAGEQ